MRWIVTSDHAGFELKEYVKAYLVKSGHEVTDLGPGDATRTDYPDWGHLLAETFLQGGYDRGVVVCGSGIGISIAANRHKGIRAALCHDEYTARVARAHNDANVLALGGRVLGEGVAEGIVDVFAATGFEGGRHAARIAKLDR